MCLAWLILFHILSIHSWLVEDDHISPDFFPKERLRATLGVVSYTVAGVAGSSVPKLALVIFRAPPVFYGITSEGLTETRIRLKFGKAQREAAAKRDADRSG